MPAASGPREIAAVELSRPEDLAVSGRLVWADSPTV